MKNRTPHLWETLDRTQHQELLPYDTIHERATFQLTAALTNLKTWLHKRHPLAARRLFVIHAVLTRSNRHAKSHPQTAPHLH